MKSLLIRLTFIPFALAILWGGKMMWHKVSAAPIPHTAAAVTLPEPTVKSDHKVQLALLLDISGSMDGLIRQAQARLWQIVNELSRANLDGQTPNLEIALYAYGGDHFSRHTGFTKQLTPFTTDLDRISELLFSLGTNGGEEYCAEVIHAAMNQLKWSRNPNDLKLMFIAGNEAFNQGNRYLFSSVCPNAQERDIIINTIYCGPFEQGVSLQWDKGAQLAGGQYLSINHNQEVVDISTPYDDQFVSLNNRLNETFIHYGYEGRLKAQNQITQDNNALNLSSTANCNRAQSKVSGNYFKSAQSWDLVGAVQDSTFSFRKLDKKTLPEQYRSYSEEQLQALVEVKQSERKRLQEEITQLSKQRDQFLKDNSEKAAEGLDAALVQCLHKQATAKGYRFIEQ